MPRSQSVPQSLPLWGGAPRSESKSNNCQWQLLHNVSVSRTSPRKCETDEGLASPYGRGAPGRGGEGEFYPLSHFVTAPPKWEPRGERIATSAAGLLAKTRINCRFSCRGGHWPPAFLRRFPKKMGGQWPPLLALSVILILIPAQIHKKACRPETDGKPFLCNFRKRLTSTDRRGTCPRQSWPSGRSPPWAYRRRRSRRTNGRERTAPGRWPSSPESAE